MSIQKNDAKKRQVKWSKVAGVVFIFTVWISLSYVLYHFLNKYW